MNKTRLLLFAFVLSKFFSISAAVEFVEHRTHNSQNFFKLSSDNQAFMLIDYKIKEFQEILSSSSNSDAQGKIISSVESIFDFERITALAIGRPWTQASPDQKKKLQSLFKDLLIKTYSNVILQFKGSSISVDPNVQVQGSQAVVKTTVRSQGKSYQIDYTLYNSGGTYRVFNISVAGASLATVYRNEFGQIISQGGIDALIKDLENRINR